MFQKCAISMAGLLFLALPVTTLAQARDTRIDELKKETAQLKALIAEQDRRIGELEKALAALQAIVSPVPKPIPSPTPAWQSSANWNLLKQGMSEAQVVELLGPPTSVSASIDVRTLLYEPDSRSSSTLRGSVTLQDDRLTSAVPPTF